MADTKDVKDAAKDTKDTAPIVTTPEEIIMLYEKLGAAHDAPEKGDRGYWNRHNSSWTNPSVVMRSLWAYGKSAAYRIADAFRRLTAIEARLGAIDARLVDLARFKQFVETRIAEAEKQLQAAVEEEARVAAQAAEKAKNGRANLAVVESSAIESSPKTGDTR